MHICQLSTKMWPYLICMLPQVCEGRMSRSTSQIIGQLTDLLRGSRLRIRNSEQHTVRGDCLDACSRNAPQ